MATVTCTEDLVEFGRMVSRYASIQTIKQTDIQTRMCADGNIFNTACDTRVHSA